MRRGGAGSRPLPLTAAGRWLPKGGQVTFAALGGRPRATMRRMTVAN